MLAAFGVAPISLGMAGFLVAWNLKLMFLFAGALMVLTAAAASLQKPVREIPQGSGAYPCAKLEVTLASGADFGRIMRATRKPASKRAPAPSSCA